MCFSKSILPSAGKAIGGIEFFALTPSPGTPGEGRGEGFSSASANHPTTPHVSRRTANPIVFLRPLMICNAPRSLTHPCLYSNNKYNVGHFGAVDPSKFFPQR